MTKLRLPKDPIERAAALVSMSLPGTRTSLPAYVPPEVAEMVLQARNERAEMYSSAEDLGDRYRTLSEEINERGVVLHIVDPDDEDSLVHHMDKIEQSLVAPIELAAGSDKIPATGRR